jgi:hypothetical protein
MFARVESGFDHFRTVTHDRDARLATISAVDKEVDATRQLLRSLLTGRDALAPISLPPPEILARVFHLLALEETPYSDKQNFGWIRRTTYECVSALVSSRTGRFVIMGQNLGHPTQLNTALISEMLARARNAPLEIDIDLVATPNPDVFLMFHPRPSHTRTLRLHSLSSLHFESVRKNFSLEAPALDISNLGFPSLR